MISCPECGSTRFWRDGFRENGKQRYLCRSCGYRFSEPGNNAFINCPTNRDHQLCVIKEAKKLVSHTETKTVGDLQSESIILEYLWYLKKKGRSELTLDAVNNRLSQLARAGLNLLQPEEISSYISKQSWKKSTKKHTVSIYGGFLRFQKIA
jgi:transcription initiation factor TFIIIB Brf1 subunit/transcription initiation factor TFIIB